MAGVDDFILVTDLKEDMNEDIGITTSAGITYMNLNGVGDNAPRYLKIEAEGGVAHRTAGHQHRSVWDGSAISGAGDELLFYKHKGGILDYRFDGNDDGFDCNYVTWFPGTTPGQWPENILDADPGVPGTAAMPGGMGYVQVNATGPWTLTLRG